MTEFADYEELFQVHFERNLAEGADNEIAELVRKIVALFEIYFSDITNSLDEIEIMANEIMENRKIVRTVQDIWESSNIELRASDAVSTKSESKLSTTPKEELMESPVESSDMFEQPPVTPIILAPTKDSESDSMPTQPANADSDAIRSKAGTLVGGGQSMSCFYDINSNTPEPYPGSIVLPRARINKKAKIGTGVYVGYLAYVGKNVTVNNNAILCDLTYLPSGTEVLENAFIIDEMDTAEVVDMLHDFMATSMMDTNTFDAEVNAMLAIQSDAE